MIAPHALRPGDACVHTRLSSSPRTLRLANPTPERLRELSALEPVLEVKDEERSVLRREALSGSPRGRTLPCPTP